MNKREFKRTINPPPIFAIAMVILVIFLCSLFIPKTTVSSKNPTHVTYIEGHPELSYKYINYDSNRITNFAYNEETKVIVAVSDGYNNKGTFIELHNADGSLMIYEGN